MKKVLGVLAFIFVPLVLLGIVYLVNNHFYPMTYKQEITSFAQTYNVPPSLVASIANTESGMNEKALSSKGAKGVMQLMPTTAEWLAGKLGKDYCEEKLFEAEYSLELDTYYLSYLLKTFEDEKVAICAYNAGQGNVMNWLSNESYSKDGKTLALIPFKETENYLNKVLKNLHYYEKRYK